MIPEEQKFLINTLADFLGERKSKIDCDINDFNWNIICETARAQQLDGIIYYQCKDLLSLINGKYNISSLKRAYGLALYQYFNRSAVLKQIDEKFTSANIPYIIFKGDEIADLYPVPSLRTMNDTDILVHSGDKERAYDILISLGFFCKSHGSHEWVFHKTGETPAGMIEIELHHSLAYEEIHITENQKSLLNKVWDFSEQISGSSTRFRLDWNFHLAYLLFHLRKHFIDKGVGLRQFADTAMVAVKCSIDTDVLNDYLQKLGIKDFSATCFSLCETWFGTEMPFKNANLGESFIDEATEKIVSDGVFGYADSSNNDNYIIYELGNSPSSSPNKLLSKIKIALSKLFPPYSEMRLIPYYSFLNGKPYLLPFFWIYRFFRSAFRGEAKKGVEKAVSPLKVSEEQIAARKELLRKWNISDSEK